MRTRMIAAALALCLAAGMFAGRAGAGEKVFRVGHITTTENSFHKALLALDEELNKRTNGGLRLRIYPNAQLGDLTELIESVQMGNLDMAISSTSFITNFCSALDVFDMPFLFENYEQVDRVLDSPVGLSYLDKVADANLKGLGWFETGFRSMATRSKPIRDASDMVGFRLRTQSSKIHQELFRALGADPAPMSLGDAFVALQQGAIDGYENSYSGMYDNKSYEVCKYGSITNHVYTPAMLFMSLDRWNGLNETERKAFMESAAVAAKVARAENRRQEEAAVDNLSKEGMIFNTADLAEFRKKSMAVYDNHPELADAVAEVREIIR